jgi:hypothetical protein
MRDLRGGDEDPRMKLRLILIVTLLALVFAQAAEAASWNSRFPF